MMLPERDHRRASARQCVLAVEASTAAGSLALVVRDDDDSGWRVLATRVVPMGSGRDDALTPAVDTLLGGCALTPNALTGVVCGAGPGSFTSLRIAAALAKGLVFALEIPLYAVSSLAWVSDAAGGAPIEGTYAVAMDALRGESYVQRVTVGALGAVALLGAVERVASATLIPGADGAVLAPDGTTVLLASADGPWCPSAAASARTAACWFGEGPVLLDAWEPAYGRLAEAQVKWEAMHGRALSSSLDVPLPAG